MEKKAKIDFDKTFKNYFHGMLAKGVYLPPSAYESYFLNDAISYQDLDHTINSFGKISIFSCVIQVFLQINNIFYNLRMRPTQQDSFRRHNFLAIHCSFVTLNPPKVYIF